MARKLASFAKTAISNLLAVEYRRVPLRLNEIPTRLQKSEFFSVMSAEGLKKKLEDTELPATKKMKLESKCVLRFAKLTEHALAPVRGSEFAAGVDLCSAYEVTVPARGKAIVKTDLQVQVPEGSYGRVAPRSGLAVKNFIDVGAGVVDEDYRGNLGVVLFNHSDVDFEVKRGDRIAQFICERIFYPELVEVDKLDDTKRGADGFGSTGVKAVSEENGNGKTPMETDEVSEEAKDVAKTETKEVPKTETKEVSKTETKEAPKAEAKTEEASKEADKDTESQNGEKTNGSAKPAAEAVTA